jgi:predicted RNA-binding Zn ribbon-like protein
MTATSDTITEPQNREALFVALANTLRFERGEATEELSDADALLAWLRSQGLISDRARAAEAQRLTHDAQEAARRLERFRYLRALLRAMASRLSAGDRPSRAQIRQLNHVLRHGLHYHQLQLDAEEARYSVAQVGDRLDQARAVIAGSFASFLAEEDPSRLRVCANDGCREIFIDHSPTGRRRWCDMRTCGNQAKVARHRARARAASQESGDRAADSRVPISATSD